MEEENNLDFGNIMSDYDIEHLFDSDGNSHEPQQTDNNVKNAETTNIHDDQFDVNPDELFGGLQESVEDGQNDTNEGKGSDTNSSSNNNFHSSILEALKKDGTLPELSDDDIANVKDDEGFRDVFDKLVQSRVDDRTRRVEQALNGGADIEQVKHLENTLGQLTNITEDMLKQEGDRGDELRRRLIAQDYMNRGFSKERIVKLLKQTFEAGTDIDDAVEALQANINFCQAQYNELIKRGQERERAERENIKKQSENLKKSIIEDNGIFNEIGVDKTMRQKIYDNISKPTYRDADGNQLTELQKYQQENPVEFLKLVSLFYTMTDGFKNIDKVVAKKALQQKKSYVKDLETKLSNVQRTKSGSLNFIGQDSDSDFLGGNFKLLDDF